MPYVVHYIGQKHGFFSRFFKDFSQKTSNAILTDLEGIVTTNEATKDLLPTRVDGGLHNNYRLMRIHFKDEDGADKGVARYIQPVVAQNKYPELGEKALIDFYLLLESATQQQFESMLSATETNLTGHGLKVLNFSSNLTQAEYDQYLSMLRDRKI